MQRRRPLATAGAVSGHRVRDHAWAWAPTSACSALTAARLARRTVSTARRGDGPRRTPSPPRRRSPRRPPGRRRRRLIRQRATSRLRTLDQVVAELLLDPHRLPRRPGARTPAPPAWRNGRSSTSAGAAAAVGRVAHDRVADRLQVHADLVGAAGLEPALAAATPPGRGTRRRPRSAVRAVATTLAHRHARRAAHRATDRRVDHAARRRRACPTPARRSAARRRARRASRPARRTPALRPRHHQQAARVAVEPVHDPRARGITDVGELRVARQEPVHERAVGVTGARVHDEARRACPRPRRRRPRSARRPGPSDRAAGARAPPAPPSSSITSPSSSRRLLATGCAVDEHRARLDQRLHLAAASSR